MCLLLVESKLFAWKLINNMICVVKSILQPEMILQIIALQRAKRRNMERFVLACGGEKLAIQLMT